MEVTQRSRTYKIGENHTIYIVENCDMMSKNNGEPIWHDISIYENKDKIADASNACYNFEEALDFGLEALYKQKGI